MNQADLILHPVRLRLLIALRAPGRTVAQLQPLVPSISRATLYRHIKLMEANGFIEVVEERPRRGTIEKVYAVKNTMGVVPRGELEAMSHAELEAHFATYVATLTATFSGASLV